MWRILISGECIVNERCSDCNINEHVTWKEKCLAFQFATKREGDISIKRGDYKIKHLIQDLHIFC